MSKNFPKSQCLKPSSFTRSCLTGFILRYIGVIAMSFMWQKSKIRVLKYPKKAENTKNHGPTSKQCL